MVSQDSYLQTFCLQPSWKYEFIKLKNNIYYSGSEFAEVWSRISLINLYW